MHQTRF